MELGNNSYPIIIGNRLLENAGEYFNLNRNVFIVTDEGVPNKYSETIEKICKKATVYTVAEGEGSKSMATLGSLLTAMSDAELGRGDCVVAVGGGVVGDLAGFASSVYMRGIDFYNVPTTLLSQVDSSIGGKTAVNLGGIKNVVGSFKQPRAVLVDTDTLKTLSKRHLSAGLCEVIKMAATSNESLFNTLENTAAEDVYNNIEGIIVEALRIKKRVVEEDEYENGIRRILNFGHTLGHGIESVEGLGGLYHGECVALGMLPVSSPDVRAKLIPMLNRFGLPTVYAGNIDEALACAAHDKKRAGGSISVVFCEAIGTYTIKSITIEEFKNIVLKHFI